METSDMSDMNDQVLKEFNNATRCKHNSKAFDCSFCIKLAGGNRLKARTENDETIGEVIDRFVERGKIGRVILEEYLGLGKRGKTIKLAKIAGLTGLSIVSVYLFYCGGQWLLKLANEKNQKSKDAKNIK